MSHPNPVNFRRTTYEKNCIWYPNPGTEPDCDPTFAHALNDFFAIATGNIADAVAGQAHSLSYPTTVQPDGELTLAFQGELRVMDPSGGVRFEFLTAVTGSSNRTRLTWQWQRTSDNKVWRNGTWQASTAPYSDLWPQADPNDVFASRWIWDWPTDTLRPKYRDGNGAAPFAPNNATNLLNNFFDGQDAVEVTIEVRMEFEDGSTADASVTRELTATHNDDLVSSMTLKVDNKEISHLHGRMGHVPNLSWTVQTTSLQAGQLQMALFKKDVHSQWNQLQCETVSNTTGTFTQVLESSGLGGLKYTLTAQATSGLFSTFSAQGPGEYQIRFSGTACVNGTWDGAFTSNVTLNPDIGYVMRFHYRDHLGSSTVSKAYTPRYDLNNPGGHPFRIKMNTAGSKVLTLYEASAQQTHFTPFGKTMGNVGESEPDPRYTDHEYDGESGFNYMKGRYQLPNYTTFNRPDPMRDWDWENPSSINLYQYVRNNPVMANDPTGFEGAGVRQGSHERRILNASTPAERERAIEDFREFNQANARGAIIGVTLLSGGTTQVARNAAGMVFEAVSGVPVINPKNVAKQVKNLWGNLKSILGKNGAKAGDSLAEGARVEKLTSHAKGELGVEKSIEDALARGETVKGTEITFELPSGKRTRADVVSDSQGNVKIIESKNGPKARLTPNQKEAQKAVADGVPLIPRGKKAKDAGLEPGVPVKINTYQVDRHDIRK